jgi:rod shape-determining protein MreD
MFVTVVILQCFLFDKLPMGTFVQPNIYILFILLLPFGYPQIKALLWAFVLGLCIDLLSTDIVGLNTAATVFLAFLRPYLLRLFSQKSDMDAYISPDLRTLGTRPCIGYVTLAVIFHQTFFFLLDSFAFYDIYHTLLRIILSTICSTILILLSQILFSYQKKTPVL